MRGKTCIHLSGIQITPIVRIDEGQLDITAGATPQHTRCKIGSKMDDIIRPAFFRRLGKNPPDISRVICFFMLVKGDIDPRRATSPDEPCWNHPGIVDDQQITRPQQGWQIADMPVNHALTHQIQQAGSVARICRMRGNCLCRQIIIEISKFHRTVRSFKNLDDTIDMAIITGDDKTLHPCLKHLRLGIGHQQITGNGQG